MDRRVQEKVVAILIVIGFVAALEKPLVGAVFFVAAAVLFFL